MNRILLGLIVTILLLVGYGCAPKSSLEPPFDTVIPPVGTLLATPKFVSEGFHELSRWEGDDVPAFEWDGEGEAPVVYGRTCEGKDTKIWMSIYELPNNSEAHIFFERNANELQDLFNITQDYKHRIEDNDEAMRWYDYEYPNWLYGDGLVSQGVMFRVGRYVGHFQMEDTHPFIVSSARASPPMTPGNEINSTFWDAIDYTMVRLHSLR